MWCGRAGMLAVRLVGGISQVHAKPVEPPLDECPALGDPALGRPQGLPVEAAGSGTAELPRLYEAARLKDLHVLQHRGERHGQRLPEFADRRRTPAKPIEHPPATGVGECAEDPIQVQLWIHHIVKHTLEYGAAPGNSQAIT